MTRLMKAWISGSVKINGKMAMFGFEGWGNTNCCSGVGGWGWGLMQT